MRRQPVAFALIDAAFLADSKWRKLGKRLPEPTAFNSAIGAWLRVLTAARRNGLPEVDAVEESEDPTYLPDLIAVGLLVETGIPDKPFRAWAPARPRYPSDVATDAPKVTNATDAPFPPVGSVSTPFPSTQLTSLEDGGVQGGYVRETYDGRADLEAFVVLRRRAPTPKQRRILDEVLDRHDLTGPAWSADVMFRHPDDPIGAVIEADKEWRMLRIAEAQAAEKPKPKPRRSPGLPQTTREIMAEMAMLKRELA